MEAGQNKALTEKEILSKQSAPTKDVVSTVNMTKVPDYSLIDQLYLKSGGKRSMLK